LQNLAKSKAKYINANEQIKLQEGALFFCQSGDPLLLFGAFGSAGAEVTDEFIYNL